LFDSGETEVQLEGEAILKKVAIILKLHPEIKVHVIGHSSAHFSRAVRWLEKSASCSGRVKTGDGVVQPSRMVTGNAQPARAQAS